MTRWLRLALALAAIALLAVTIWWARVSEMTPSDRIEAAGTVRPQLRTIAAPAIVYPVVDYTVGIPTRAGGRTELAGAGGAGGAVAGGAGAGGAVAGGAVAGGAGAKATPRPGQPTLSGVLATVTVRQGDVVKAGDTVALLDTTLLDLGVRSAEAAAARARADVGLLSDQLDSLEEKNAELDDARSNLNAGRKKLLDTRTQLRDTRDTLVSSRAKAVAGRSAIRTQIAQLESIQTTPTPQREAMLAGLKQKLAEVEAGITKIDAGIRRVDAGLAQVADGLRKLPSAEQKLSTARGTLRDARDQVSDARDTLEIVADAATVAVQLAKERRGAATITAPEAGVVVFARPAGTAVMAGAPVVRIRPFAPTLIDTYLTVEQLQRVALGKGALARSDSLPGRVFEGRVARIGDAAEFPPTSFPTHIVHMMRTVRVTIELEPGASPPPGTPVDLTIFTALP